MPTLKNSRRENFARLLASGKTATDAYEEAGYERNDGNAAAMAKKEEIQNRVMEINTLAAHRIAITKEKLIEWADEIRREACAHGQYSAAIAALKEIGILTGLRIERSERGQPGEFDTVSTEQLLAELRDLGYAVDVPPSQAVN